MCQIELSTVREEARSVCGLFFGRVRAKDAYTKLPKPGKIKTKVTKKHVALSTFSYTPPGRAEHPPMERGARRKLNSPFVFAQNGIDKRLTPRRYRVHTAPTERPGQTALHGTTLVGSVAQEVCVSDTTYSDLL